MYIKKNRLWPIAVSKSDASRCLGVAPSALDMMIATGKLTVRVPDWGVKRKMILVEDLVAYVREHWTVETKGNAHD
jgi:hypothetical protein